MVPPENEITHSAIATFVSIIKSMVDEDHVWDNTADFSDKEDNRDNASRFDKQLDTFIKYLAFRETTSGKLSFGVLNCVS